MSLLKLTAKVARGRLQKLFNGRKDSGRARGKLDQLQNRGVVAESDRLNQVGLESVKVTLEKQSI